MSGGKMSGGKRAKKKKELLGLTLSHVVPLMTARKVGENEWGKSAKKQIFCTDTATYGCLNVWRYVNVDVCNTDAFSNLDVCRASLQTGVRCHLNKE